MYNFFILCFQTGRAWRLRPMVRNSVNIREQHSTLIDICKQFTEDQRDLALVMFAEIEP